MVKEVEVGNKNNLPGALKRWIYLLKSLKLLYQRIICLFSLYSNNWKAYNGLVDYRIKEYFRVKFYKNEFEICKNYISGIDYFQACAEHILYFIAWLQW